MKTTTKISAWVLFLLAITTFSPPFWLWMWMAQIVSTEYGHIGALLCVITAVFAYTFQMRTSIGMLAVAFVLFLVPAYQLKHSMPAWNVLLEDAFGPETGDKIPELTWGWISPSFRFRMERPEVVFYKDDPDAKLKMEVFRAQNTLSKKVPWVLVVPGGSWREANPSAFWELNVELARQGYAVVSIEYRVLPKFHWPTPREDVITAVDYVKTHAESWGLDPDRWVILGRSAGGQLAESVAYELKPPGLKGVVSFYAPSDMNLADRFAKMDDLLKTKFLLRDFLGKWTDVKSEDFDPLSPIRFVGKDSPPTLLFHGPGDVMVWNLQSQRLSRQLQANGVSNLYLELPWATHGFDYASGGPGWQVSTYAIKRFLKNVMPAEKTAEPL